MPREQPLVATLPSQNHQAPNKGPWDWATGIKLKASPSTPPIVLACSYDLTISHQLLTHSPPRGFVTLWLIVGHAVIGQFWLATTTLSYSVFPRKADLTAVV
ncbi:hypothetical protein F5Y19DRAFT_474536 [Xylariaceae sp. FL1651]|nr:hypothetical protein F5Y19DRAFT_474536 [Xylariaceae sp. FL1651]